MHAHYLLWYRWYSFTRLHVPDRARRLASMEEEEEAYWMSGMARLPQEEDERHGRPLLVDLMHYSSSSAEPAGARRHLGSNKPMSANGGAPLEPAASSRHSRRHTPATFIVGVSAANGRWPHMYMLECYL